MTWSDSPIRKTVFDSEDLVSLATQLESAGGPIRGVRVAYGDAVEMQFGQEDQLPWTISTEGSRWRLWNRDSREGLESERPGASQDLAGMLEGGHINSVSVTPDLALLLNLADGRALAIEGYGGPAEALGLDTDVPYWEALTGDGRVIAAGPGPVWASYRDDVPERELPWARPSIRSGERPGTTRRLPLAYSFDQWAAALGLVIATTLLTVVTLLVDGDDALKAASISLLLVSIAVLAAATFRRR